MSSYNIPSTQTNINNFQEPQLSPQQQYNHHEQQNQQYSPELPQLTRKNSNLSLHSSRSIVTANSTMSTSTAPRNVATESLFAYDDRFQRKSRSSTRLQTLKTVRSDSMTSLSAYNNNNIKRNSDMRILPKSSSFSNSSNYRPNIPNSISASNISSLSDHQAANAFQSHSNASSRRPSMTSTSQLYHSNSSTSLNPTYRSQNTSSLVTPPPKLNTNNSYPRNQKPNVSKVPNVNKSPKSPNAPNGMYLFPNGEIFRPRQTPKNRSSRPQKINRQIYQQQQQHQQQQQYDYIPKSNQIRNNAPVDNKLLSYSSMPNLKSFNRASNMENQNGVNNYPNQVYRANNFPPINSFNSNNSTVITSHNINTGINNNGSSNTFDEEITNMTPLNEFRIENDMDTNNSGSLSSRTAISTTQSSISQGDHIYSDSLPSHSNNSSNSSNVTNDKLSSPPLNSISNLQSNNNKTTNSNNSIITPSNSSTSSSLVLNNQNALQSPLTLLSSYETLNSSADDELDNTHCNLKANLSMIKESATINDSLPTPTTTTDSIKFEENPEDLNDKIETIDIIEDKTEPQPINNFTKEFENLNDDSSIVVRKAPVLPTPPQPQEPQLESKRSEVYTTPVRNSIASTNSTVNRLRKNEEVARKPSMMKKMFGKLFSRSSSNSSTSTAPSTKEKKSLYQLPKEKSSSTWSLASKFKKQPSKQTNKNVSTTVTNTNSNNAVKRSSNLYNQVYNANLQPPVATTLNDQPVIKEEEEGKEEASNPLDQSTVPITKTTTYNYDFDDLNSFEIGDDTFLQEGNDLLTEAANFVEVDDNSEKKDPTYHQYTPSDSEEKLDSGLETGVEDQNPSSENASNDISLTSIPIDTNSDNVDISFDEDMDLDYISTIIGLGETSLFFDHKHQNEPSALQRRKSIRIKSLEKRKSLIRHNTIGSNRSNNSTIFGEDGTSSTIKSFDSFSNTHNDEMDDDMDFYDDFKSLQKTHMNGVDTSKMNKVESFEVITTNQLKLPLSKLDLLLMPRKKSCLKPITKNFSSQSKFSIGGNSSHNSNASSATVSPDSSSSSLYKNNNNTSSYVQLNPNKTNSSTSLDSALSFTPLSHNHTQQTPSLSPSQQQQNQFMNVSELTSIPPIKKTVSFSNKVRLNDTFSPHDYDRFNLPLKQRYQYLSNNPSKIKDIRIELNTFKQRDMPIHELSKAYTHFLHT